MTSWQAHLPNSQHAAASHSSRIVLVSISKGEEKADGALVAQYFLLAWRPVYKYMSFSSGCLCPPEDIVLWQINPVPLLWHGLIPSYICKLSNFIPVPFSWHPLCNLIRASVTLHMYCFATSLLANEVHVIPHCHLYFALLWEIGQSSNFF